MKSYLLKQLFKKILAVLKKYYFAAYIMYGNYMNEIRGANSLYFFYKLLTGSNFYEYKNIWDRR
jgi:hypothetical protein